MRISPDELVLWQYGPVKLNATIVYTWVLMLIMTLSAGLVTRRLKTDTAISRWQSLLEILVFGLKEQIEQVGLTNARKYLGFLGTLFLFIATANLFIIFPWYEPPTGSISTTVALALSVFLAVPVFGIADRGIKGYLKSYLEPTFLMLPFNIISEISRTLALAVRLFGNIMSGTLIIAILLSIAPFIFPIVMTALGLITGLVQAYIFAILATVFIAAVTGNAAIETSDQETDAPDKSLNQKEQT